MRLLVAAVWRAVSFLLLLTFPSYAKTRFTSQQLAFASPSIPPPPAISVPVWSLASPLPSTGETSMNIVTFATPVSVAPPKLWIVSLYTNTLTRRAFLDSKVAVLQLLTPSLKNVVPILGKRSGYEEGYSKKDACAAAGHAWTSNEASQDTSEKEIAIQNDSHSSIGISLLPGCATYIRLTLLSTVEAGDHDVALCQVQATARWDSDTKRVVPTDDEGPPPTPLDPSTALYTGLLRDEGII